MAITAAPFALKNLGLDAEPLRQALASLVPNAGGVVQTGDLAVTQTGTPSLGVQVGVGRAWMPGTNTSNLSGQSYSTQGQYFAINDAAFTVNLTTANATNPRIDLIYIGAVDTQYGGASNVIKIDKVTGTPAATPTVPTLPANSIALAQVAVAANATSVTNANITTVAVGAVKPFGHSIKTNGFQAANGLDRVTLNTAQILKGGMTFDDATDSFIVPIAGLYRVTLQLYTSGTGASTQLGLVYQNNVTQLSVSCRTVKNGGEDNVALAMGIVQLNANDKVSPYWQGAANVSVWGNGSSGTYLQVEYFGPA